MGGETGAGEREEGLVAQDPDAKMTVQDVVIAGGGVSGLSIALHLKMLGVPRVTVLERHHAGAGQSGRAAGIIRALVNNEAVASILMESLRFVRNFKERFGQPIPFHQPGYLLVNDAAASATMDQTIANANLAGCGASRISASDAVALQPGLRCGSEDIYAYEPGALHLDPMLATQVLARVARGLGVRIEEGCQVDSILIDGSRAMGVSTREGRFLADSTVLATSVLGAAQLKQIGVEVPVFPHRAEMAFFSVFPQSTHRLQRILSDARTLLYMRPEGVDQMFVGWREGDRIATPDDFAAVDPENYRQTSGYPTLADMRNRLTGTLPFMTDGYVHRTYACVYDYTPDGMPILDEAEGRSGLYFALGYSGGGFSLSPWVGAAMARFITERVKSPEMHLLRLSRFREGTLLSWSNAAGRDRDA
ncbi:MAG: NAD(P)/FAD-dependent oxidoreductase [Bryobacteraceae bacterium]